MNFLAHHVCLVCPRSEGAKQGGKAEAEVEAGRAVGASKLHLFSPLHCTWHLLSHSKRTSGHTAGSS